MNTYIVRSILCCALLSLFGCAPSSTSTPESEATNLPTTQPTEVNIVEFEITDFPKARNFSLASGVDGNVYAVFGQGHSLFVSRSTDGGKTFSPAVLATGENDVHILPIEPPAIASGNNGRVSIAWLEIPPDFNGGNIWYAVSDDSGETFTPGHLIATEAEGEVAMVQVALDDDGNPILAWLNDSELKFARSFDGGLSFEETISIGDGACECCQPQPISINEHIYIAYRGLEADDEKGDIRDILMIRSDDGGRTFLPATRVSDAHWYLPACPIAGPSFTTHQGKFYVAWMDGRFEPIGQFRRGDVWLSTSNDGGDSFSPNIRVNPDQDMHHTLPSIAIGSGGRLHIAWEAHPQTPGNILLYYSTSDDDGQTFAPPQIIADSSDSTRGSPGKPILAVDQFGRVTLGWVDRQGARVASWTDTN